MRHEIDGALWVERLGPGSETRVSGMQEAVERCVHCGFCLATCPTYRTMGEEMDSPRGRIFLLKELLEEKLTAEEVFAHVDPCLGCLACETSCPSGVRYRDLLQPMRAYGESARRRSLAHRLRRAALLEVLARPTWFRWAARLGRIARPLRGWLPSSLAAPLEMLPSRRSQGRSIEIPSHCAAQGPTRARVALLTGCVQSVLDPDVSAAAIEVLTRNGVEVVVPPQQGCCGSLALHVGDERRARRMARHNALVFEASEVDAVVTCAAGCGSGLQESYELFAASSESEARDRAKALSSAAVDVCQFLAELDLVAPPPASAGPVRIGVHDACHLQHAQRVRAAPRQLLRRIEGVQLLEPLDAEVCCGSAGLYNLEHPETGDELGRMKCEQLSRLRPDVIASGNVGCTTQISRFGSEGALAGVPVLHPVQILRDAYRNTLRGSNAS